MVMYDCLERRHVHVKGNGKGGAKFWLEPEVAIASPGQYNRHELSQIYNIIQNNLAKIIQEWDKECARLQSERSASN